MNKIAALDLGDKWVGIAISDSLRILARPYTTVALDELEDSIKKLLSCEPIEIIVVGYPKTMRGTESAQTLKIIQNKESLEQKFPEISWIMWDERLSSKRAQVAQVGGKKKKSSEDKLKEHAIAAAFILDLYLTSCIVVRDEYDDDVDDDINDIDE